MKKVYVRIPMEERLKRVSAGYASSPQFSQVQVERFCATPVVPALECMEAFAERRRLCDLLKEEPIKSLYGKKRAEDVTFGDLASIITDYCKKYGTEEPDNAEEVYYPVQQLLAAYFCCFDGILYYKKQVRGFQRSQVNPSMQSVYDILHVSFEDYCIYAAQCDPARNIEKIDSYRSKKGMSRRMNPLAIYEELKMNFWYIEEKDYDFDVFKPLTLKECMHLIDFFIYPVAMITKNGPAVNRIINSRISKGANHDENSK